MKELPRVCVCVSIFLHISSKIIKILLLYVKRDYIEFQRKKLFILNAHTMLYDGISTQFLFKIDMQDFLNIFKYF